MRVNEIFYSLQGEGRFTGTPAVFVRFSGCNMKCPFCDTSHENYSEMSEEDIVKAVSAYAASHIVLTGGEPTLQITASLVSRLHAAGKFVQIETNGTMPLPEGCEVDWVTCSPKLREVRPAHINELKLVFHSAEDDISHYESIPAEVYSLQPCDTGNAETNARILKEAIDYCLAHPLWHLSLQTHKIINIL